MEDGGNVNPNPLSNCATATNSVRRIVQVLVVVHILVVRLELVDDGGGGIGIMLSLCLLITSLCVHLFSIEYVCL